MSLLQEQARALSKHGMKKHLRILPMYSGLPYPDQMKVFERVPRSVRKVILQSMKCLPYLILIFEFFSSLYCIGVPIKISIKVYSLLVVFVPLVL